ncbi:hypothetical protein [Halorhabdus salina]|uniref:hypothetical protein n=1 Tax=Halorhabdus salina TaxID=2750670 RepID=UPI0015EF194C|nr:hypothetical protein [Halorhabdus salina]
MAFGKIRTQYVVIALFSVAVMFGHDVLVEFGLEGSRLGAASFAVITGTAGSILYENRLKQTKEIDERVERIRRSGAEWAFAFQSGAIGVVLLLLYFGGAELPIVPVLFAIMIGGVVVYELAIEYYRRKM